MADADLPDWLDEELEDRPHAGAIADLGRVRTLLVEAAREGRAVSYSELLASLGHRFTRPKMRALCRTLDAIDVRGAAAGEPELAVLVVRESDRLPGQGWWAARSATGDYEGLWQGPEALAFIQAVQQRTFAFWRGAAVTHSRSQS